MIKFFPISFLSSNPQRVYLQQWRFLVTLSAYSHHLRSRVSHISDPGIQKHLLQPNQFGSNLKHFCQIKDSPEEGPSKMVKILNVAEKNDAAKNIASLLSRGGSTRREGMSQFNKIYEFPYTLNGQQVQMVFTSVSGHLLNWEFTGNYKKWYGCSPVDLFNAPVSKACKEESMERIKKTLEREVRGASKLIVWTDCDREGENIGYEVITVCQAVKPNINVLRAKFSEITPQSITRSINNLGRPDPLQNKAVDVRSELDLRIGAAFTRFQTMRLQKVFPSSLADTLISYGSCQFPTLGFVVQRYKQIQNFIPENFWKIKVVHAHDEGAVDFSWLRVRLFNELACQVILDTCTDDPLATVTSVVSKPKSKWRPLPLDTVEFEKMSSRKLKIAAKAAMKIAEKLYTGGLISYPRTETNIFPKELNLVPLVEMQTVDNNWGAFAGRVLERGPRPRQGKKTDEAHPPIHPTKAAPHLQGDERKVYELITRSFLACLSDDAKGHETIVEIGVAGENFRASGLIILEKNYLEVYPYDKWTDKPMPHYEMGMQFTPQIELVGGQTAPPSLLTEADLISLMEKHGIGTDATHAEHIETIKSRSYVGLQDQRFIPGTLGMGLVNGYDDMGFQMSQPHLRAGLEEDLKAVCEGRKDGDVVLRDQVTKYKQVFEEAIRQASKLDSALSVLLDEAPQAGEQEVALQSFDSVGNCSLCQSMVVVKQKRNGTGFFATCQGYPDCKVCLWFPESVIAVEVTPEKCQQCANQPNLLRLKFKPRSYRPMLPDTVTTCIYGCDNFVLDTLGVRPLPSQRVPNRANVNDRGDRVYNMGAVNNRGNTNNRGRGNAANRGNANNRGNSNNRGNNNRENRGTGSTRGNRNGPSNSLDPDLTPDDWGDDNFGDEFFPDDNDDDFGGGGSGGAVSSGNYRGTNNSHFTSRTPASQHQSTYNDTGSTGGEGDRIICDCRDDALMLTVRKEGPNTGRQFYKCPKPMGQGCNFFLWADEGGGSGPSSTGGRSGGEFRGSSSGYNSSGGGTNPNYNSTLTSPSSDTENCQCSLPVVKRTVQKEGANKGREFYVCSKDFSSKCNYFQWADEPSGGGGGNNFNSNGEGFAPRGRRGGGAKRGASSSGGGSAPKKRKCGLCGEVGHNRKNCHNS